MEKRMFFGTIIIFLLVILFVNGLILNIYSTQTAKTYCKEKGMVFYDLSKDRKTFDLKDDVICYTTINNEIKLFYFKRD